MATRSARLSKEPSQGGAQTRTPELGVLGTNFAAVSYLSFNARFTGENPQTGSLVARPRVVLCARFV